MAEMNDVPIPEGLKERQIRLARAFSKDKHELGITIKDFTRKHSMSTATWYSWLENPVFEKYLNDLQGNVITDDERAVYHKVKKKIMAMATAKNAGVKEIELFNQHFSYVIEAEKRDAMQKLGINSTGSNTDTRTVEQKKARLLQRLKG